VLILELKNLVSSKISGGKIAPALDV